MGLRRRWFWEAEFSQLSHSKARAFALSFQNYSASLSPCCWLQGDNYGFNPRFALMEDLNVEETCTQTRTEEQLEL